jgi:hypothetical protein
MCAREGKAVPACYKTSAMLLIESILYLNIAFVFNIIKRIYVKFIGTLFSKKYIVWYFCVFFVEKGIHSDHFRIDNNTGNVTIIKSLDRENITIVRLKIKAVDISEQLVTRQCPQSVLTQKNSTTMDLLVYIQDQNDHKPQFKSNYLSKGVRRTVNKGVTIFDLKVSVEWYKCCILSGKRKMSLKLLKSILSLEYRWQKWYWQLELLFFK